jgi:CRISPR-associated endonuclease/helicase Cas3
MAEGITEIRKFQIEARDFHQAKKNVIIHAPTGSGKTQAALRPYTTNLQHGRQDFPLHCLYATPMRVLSNQFHDTYQGFIKHIDKKQGTSYFRQHGYEQLKIPMVSIQTGEHPTDPQFEAMLTFCTIDQLLASFLGVPYTIGKRMANLNVGAILSSYLIFDEFHLYPLVNDDKSCFGARTTVLVLLSLLQNIARFTLMTATFSTTLLDELKKMLNAEIVKVSEDELEDMIPGRRRWFELAGTSLDAKQVMARHDRCSLVVCNTVIQAQSLYWQLRPEAQTHDIELVLLHSRLTDEDRTQRSQKIRDLLGPTQWKNGEYKEKNCIVVATQVIEVGLDISVQTLHTELAPANSLIQRAGRCARYKQQHGHVIVYDLPSVDGKPPSALPYDKKLCDATRDALAERDSSQPMRFTDEQALIDAVHTEEDRQLLEDFRQKRGEMTKLIFAGLKDQDTSIRSDLIRDVAQVQVIIHDDPKKAIKKTPWRWQSFSLHPASLTKYLRVCEEHKDEIGYDWLCKQAVLEGQEVTTSKKGKPEEEEDNRAVTLYTWTDIPYTSQARPMERMLRDSLMVAVPNSLATYHPELGFILLDKRLPVPWTTYQSPEIKALSTNRFQYKPIVRRSYREHIQGLVLAYNSGIAQSLAYAVSSLETLLSLPAGSIDHAIRLTLACHDLGKLSIAWQKWALEWKCLLYERQNWNPYQHDPAFFFGKTDYDSGSPDQRRWQHDTKTKRPNHACESVMIGKSLIADSLGVTSADSPLFLLWRASCTAIAKHHTTTAHESGATQLKPGAEEEARLAMEDARQNLPWSYQTTKLNTDPLTAYTLWSDNDDPQGALLTIPRQGRKAELETWLYFLIARALRLADQRADDFCN